MNPEQIARLADRVSDDQDYTDEERDLMWTMLTGLAQRAERAKGRV